MLASGPVAAARERAGSSVRVAATVAGLAAFCALFFGDGSDPARLVWIGALALAVAALPLAASLAGLAPAISLDRAGRAFAGCVAGLAVWTGLSTLWSLSPDASWRTTNETLVYLAFAVAGIVLGAWLPRPALAGARAAAALLALLYGWALLAKCVPALYSDYGRIARLRAPLGDGNMLALFGAAGVPVALWLAGTRRAAGTVLLYAAVLVALLTYSRDGVALALLAAVPGVALGGGRVERLVTAGIGVAAAAAVYGAALALPGITADGEPHGTRVVDGGLFAGIVVVAAALVALAAGRLGRLDPSPAARRRIERWAGRAGLAVAVVLVVLAGAFSQRLWHSFANPAASQIGSQSGRVASLNSSNRWRWWQEEWSAFTGHPLLGTGAGTFHLTDLRLRQSGLVTTDDPHNVPLRFLGELGIVGFLLYLGAAAAAALGIVRAARRAAGEEAAAIGALGLALAVFFLHAVANWDWLYLAACGPFLLLPGLLLGRRGGPSATPAGRRILALAAVLVALGGVYSLAAPWLADRTLASAVTLDAVKSAHSYDPLNTEALLTWATLEDVNGNALQALKLYKDATALEPQTSEVWYQLGSFYYEHKDWPAAYDALSRAWRYDPYTVGVPCGLLDQARHRAIGVWAPSCPRGSVRAAHP